MTQLSLPNYNALNRVLSKTPLKMHASQAHGFVAGILCGNVSEGWEEIITGAKEIPKPHTLLQQLYHISAKQLHDFLFEFQLILPPDKETLGIRAEALTLWCQGFLTGLKLVNISIEERPVSDVTEAINDLIEISKMNYEDVVANEEDEQAYAELVEYIRMAIILIYQNSHEDNLNSDSKSAELPLH